MIYLVGMKLSQAIKRLKEENIKWRIISEDGNSCPVTDDFNGDRYNLTVVEDKVTEVSYG